MTGEIRLEPIGFVRSPIRDRDSAPRQGRDSGVVAEVEILPTFEDAVLGLEKHARIQVICWMHLARRDLLQVHASGDLTLPLSGVFATRSPSRPNPLAVYTLELVEVEGLRLTVRGIDAVDGTPVLDIRPHIQRLDD